MRYILMISGAIIAIVSGCAAYDERGHMAQAGDFHVELYVQGRNLTVYVWDRTDRPIDAAAVRATAFVRAPGGDATVGFVPIGEALQGHAPFALGEAATVKVTFSVRGGPDNQAEFSPVGGQGGEGHKH